MLTDLQTADEIAYLTSIRHDLHAHPELGFEEKRTGAIVANVLSDAGITVHRGLGETGVVGTLKYGSGGMTIALRADMDALAMPETADHPYKSTIDGKMHACGHDGHTTMLLGAARRLSKISNLSGTVHFIFQPAEEGRGGAKRMVDDGLFDLFPCDAVFGMHNMPGLAVDEMAVVGGPQLASSDSWKVTLTGIGTHGAKPHLGRDPITAGGIFSARCRPYPVVLLIHCSLPLSVPARYRQVTRKPLMSFRILSRSVVPRGPIHRRSGISWKPRSAALRKAQQGCLI